jgi:hypothetical protein
MRSPSLVFTRRIHALHDLFTNTVAGRLAKLEGKALPSLENDVRLQDRKGKTIATVRSMDSLVSHLEPFSYLRKLPSEKPVYRIVQLMKFPSSQKRSAEFKRAGTGKELHVTTTSSDGTWKHTVSKAHEFLSKGWRVEFHVRPIIKNKVNTIDWALRNALHMRPEVITAAMPEGTQVLMPPVQDGTELLWVLDHEKNRLKAGYTRRKPTQSKMPIGTGIAKAAPAGKQIVQPKDRRSLCHKSSDTHIWEAHSNPQAEDDVDKENPENPISKRFRESAPKKKISLPGPEISDKISSTQVHRLPAGGDMKTSANTYSYPRGVSKTTATTAQD